MIISNNLIGKMPIPDDAVIRINLAWVNNLKEADRIIRHCGHEVYLDYPSGRTKPPKPTLSLKEAIELAQNENVKYFAISNSENVDLLTALSLLMPNKIIVPKIETEEGVKKMDQMKLAGITAFTLDKEDLYTNVDGDSERYNKLVEEARTHNNVMELQGVIFNAVL